MKSDKHWKTFEIMLFILGLYPDKHNAGKSDIIVLDFCFLLAKGIIANFIFMKMGKLMLYNWLKELYNFTPGKNNLYVKK